MDDLLVYYYDAGELFHLDEVYPLTIHVAAPIVALNKLKTPFSFFYGLHNEEKKIKYMNFVLRLNVTLEREREKESAHVR
jgi:hypothetical protein